MNRVYERIGLKVEAGVVSTYQSHYSSTKRDT